MEEINEKKCACRWSCSCMSSHACLQYGRQFFKFLKCEYALVIQFITGNFLASSLCEIVRTREKNEGGPPKLLFNGYRASLPGVKQAKREPNLYRPVPWLNKWSYTSTPTPQAFMPQSGSASSSLHESRCLTFRRLTSTIVDVPPR